MTDDSCVRAGSEAVRVDHVDPMPKRSGRVKGASGEKLQRWVRQEFERDDEPLNNPAARDVRAENARRFAKHLKQCPRAVRVS